MDRHQRKQIYYELSDWFGQSIGQSGGVGKARRCEFLAVARHGARALAMLFFRTMQAEVGENPGTSHTLTDLLLYATVTWTNKYMLITPIYLYLLGNTLIFKMPDAKMHAKP